MLFKNRGLFAVLILGSGTIMYIIYSLIIWFLHRVDIKLRRKKYENLNEAISRFLIDNRVALTHYLYFALVFLIVTFGTMKLKNILIGIGISTFGTFIRVWAMSYKMTNKKLIRYGPYALIRHPRYLGNFIIGIGVTLLSPNILIMLFYALSFFILYFTKIREEEKILIVIFGDEYRKYKEDVSTIIPIISFISLIKLRFTPLIAKVETKYRINNKGELFLRSFYAISLNLFATFILYLKCFVIPFLVK